MKSTYPQPLLADLNDRIDRAVSELARIHNPARYPRIAGKIDGLLLVKDWLRSYE